MSTKAIRDGLIYLKNAGWSKQAERAMAELEAIEKAAAELSRSVADRGPEYIDAERLMAAIARQKESK